MAKAPGIETTALPAGWMSISPKKGLKKPSKLLSCLSWLDMISMLFTHQFSSAPSGRVDYPGADGPHVAASREKLEAQ